MTSNTLFVILSLEILLILNNEVANAKDSNRPQLLKDIQ